MVQWKKMERCEPESAIFGFLIVPRGKPHHCSRISYPTGTKTGQVSYLLHLLEALNFRPGILIRRANIPFLFKIKWHISVRNK